MDFCTPAVTDRPRIVLGPQPFTAALIQLLGSSGMRTGALAGGLEANTWLQTLRLDSNEITDAGARELAGALEANTSLQRLDLDGNEITSVGAVVLLEAWGDRRDLWRCPLRTLVGDAWVAKAAE